MRITKVDGEQVVFDVKSRPASAGRPESMRCGGQHLAAPGPHLFDDVGGRRDVVDTAGDLTGVGDAGVHVASEIEPLHPLQRRAPSPKDVEVSSFSAAGVRMTRIIRLPSRGSSTVEVSSAATTACLRLPCTGESAEASSRVPICTPFGAEDESSRH